MVAKFDNYEDVNGKFAGTICYYDGKPVLIKGAIPDPEGGKEFYLSIINMAGKGTTIKVEDPKFNYKDFNIGYANCGTFASWWFRKPHKQFRQGLKKDQMAWRTSIPGAQPDDYFNLSKPFNQMLENKYPSLEECQLALKGKMAAVIAFHKDFALSWDDIHNSYILEYRAKRIGATTGDNLKNFKIVPEYDHLKETLKEVLPHAFG